MRIEEVLQKLDNGSVMSRGENGVGIMRSARVTIPKEVVKKMFGVDAPMVLQPSLLALSREGSLSPYIITTDDLNADDWRVSNLSLGESENDAIKHRGFITVPESESEAVKSYIYGYGLGEIVGEAYNNSHATVRFTVESTYLESYDKADGIPNYTMLVDEILEKVVFVREV